MATQAGAAASTGYLGWYENEVAWPYCANLVADVYYFPDHLMSDRRT